MTAFLWYFGWFTTVIKFFGKRVSLSLVRRCISKRSFRLPVGPSLGCRFDSLLFKSLKMGSNIIEGGRLTHLTMYPGTPNWCMTKRPIRDGFVWFFKSKRLFSWFIFINCFLLFVVEWIRDLFQRWKEKKLCFSCLDYRRYQITIFFLLFSVSGYIPSIITTIQKRFQFR